MIWMKIVTPSLKKQSGFCSEPYSLISFCLISIEITFSRLLSVLLSYHYVFVVLSLALLGLGAGGVFVHRFGS